MKYKPQHLIEYILLVIVAGLIRALPLRVALGLGWLVAAGSHFIGRVKVERTHERIRQVLGKETPKKEVRRIAWISWRNIFFNAIDALRFSKLTPKKIKKQPIASLEPKLTQILNELDTGFVIATPHMGNWEIAGVAADLAGIPIFAIARKQKNPLIDGYINKMRQSFDLEILFTGAHVGKGVVDRLKRGKVLAILPDIGSRNSTALTVGFLNGQATIAPGAAQFAQLAHCPIYPICMRRIGWTKHTAVMLDPITPNPTLGKDEDQQRIMTQLMATISKEILKTPEQYFWYNKRWVLNPSETK